MSLVRISINIESWDNTWLVNSFSLRQSYKDHHAFEINALVPQPGKGAAALSPESLISILGQTAQITIQRIDQEGGECTFEGFVDQVTPIWVSQACMLRITGYSKTLWMDGGPRFRTFSQRKVTEIAQKICGNYKMPLGLRNAKGNADFSVQIQETDYRYLSRIADEYGNVFYFDGKQLHFGSLEHENSGKTTLAFGENLKQAQLSLNASPLNFQISGYQLESSQILKSATTNSHHNSGIANGVAQRSAATYPAGNVHLFNLVADQDELKHKAGFLSTMQAQQLLRFSGVTNIPGLKIGSKITVKDSREMFAQGEYVIIELTHTVDNDHSYHNTFVAVPAGYPFPPRMQSSRSPRCGPLMAVVKDHKDPKQLGRIKVQFIGDEEKTLSPWLRVLTAYTGFGGMYFLPEKEDQVLVFSEDFNIEKSPFVMPAFYHGQAPAKQWYDPENKKKGFTTEKIAFKIDDRTGKLYIEADEIEIVSRKKMKLDAGKEMFQQADVFETKAEQKMTHNGGTHLTLKAKRIDLNP